MKKERSLTRKTTLAGTRNSAIKQFLAIPPSHLSLQPMHVLVLSLCFIGNIVLLHVIGRFGSSSVLQIGLSTVAVVAAIVLGYLVGK
ncbi:protein transport protein SEC61 subunit beta [Nematocida sp. AWRm77]|nr:protein transport protein SEC61 subunit beta [Nematocida sp. AWRm77]